MHVCDVCDVCDVCSDDAHQASVMYAPLAACVVYHLYAQMMLADDEGKQGLARHERNSRSFKLHALNHAPSICVRVRQISAGEGVWVDEGLTTEAKETYYRGK